MFFSFIRVQVHGKENLPQYPKSPSIIVMNHTSCLDIFIMEKLFRYPHIWLTKSVYTKIPLFSILLHRMHVLVKNENNIAAAQALLQAHRLAKNVSSHIFIFPEGARFDDGKIHEFNPGFALLAKKLNRPVIPILIQGFHKILPKNKIRIDYRAAKAELTIGKPIFIQKNETRDDFSNRVHSWFQNRLS